MHEAHWRKPVQAGGRAIHNPLEAIRFMDREWPGKKTMSFAEAHQACLAALDGREPADGARASFKDAVDEAQVH
ncbi:DUF982 domain-containing protein [Rhizobium sp. SL86]|uniref:DUF982 domain-containing protein n=1 Tax=Rhizobium sp. SL86 TaxID=2995148 RepID=UPI002276186A|nr:DUF982 domain-containing protein [Rhizobium sp. SL86]MCY1669129.1 DUF982 domain-containing protein [Rhizobium sp. SL86]